VRCEKPGHQERCPGYGCGLLGAPLNCGCAACGFGVASSRLGSVDQGNGTCSRVECRCSGLATSAKPQGVSRGLDRVGCGFGSFFNGSSQRASVVRLHSGKQHSFGLAQQAAFFYGSGLPAAGKVASCGSKLQRRAGSQQRRSFCCGSGGGFLSGSLGSSSFNSVGALPLGVRVIRRRISVLCSLFSFVLAPANLLRLRLRAATSGESWIRAYAWDISKFCCVPNFWAPIFARHSKQNTRSEPSSLPFNQSCLKSHRAALYFHNRYDKHSKGPVP